MITEIQQQDQTPDPAIYEPMEDGRYRMRVSAIMQMCLTEAGFPDRVLAECGAAPVGIGWRRTFSYIAPKLGHGLLTAWVGNRGAGKTRMAVEIVKHRVMAVNAGIEASGNTRRPGKAIYIRAMQMFLELRQALKGGGEYTETGYIERLTQARLLIVDEVQERGETDWEDKVFRHIIDVRYGARRDTILIGNLSAAAFSEVFGASVADRMRDAGGIVTFNWPSFRAAEGRVE